jgi:hypothetical protein
LIFIVQTVQVHKALQPGRPKSAWETKFHIHMKQQMKLEFCIQVTSYALSFSV